MRLVTKIRIVGLVALLPFLANAQGNTGEIKGKITEKDKTTPVIGASVYVEVAGVPFGTASDPDGRFTLKPLDAGTYIVTISFMGMATQKHEVIIKPNQIHFMNDLVMVESDTGFTLDDIEVVAFKDPLINPNETGMKSVDYKQIKNSPALRDIKKLASTLTSEMTVNEGTGDSYVRGSRSDAAAYFLDGVKCRDGKISVPGIAIGNLTVYTGGVPAKYGDVTSGVIILETKSYFDLYYENNH